MNSGAPAQEFERIVEEHSAAVYRICAGHLGTQSGARGGAEDAEDAAQEVFTRIYLGLKTFKGESSVGTWIFRIATNVALTRARRRRSRPRTVSLEAEGTHQAPPGSATATAASAAASGADDPGEALEASERREAVRRAIAQLPEDQRAVVLLRSEGLSFEDVARILGILRPTAESRMARAKERLRVLLQRYVQGET